MSDMLSVKGLSISFGGLKAVNNFAINIEKGQLYGLIGPNGAGKTTIFNLLTGVYKPDTGTILLDGQNLTGKSTTDINKAGIARTFQNIRLFKDLSVLDNVKAGLHNHHTYSTLEGILRLPRYYKAEKEMDEEAMDVNKQFYIKQTTHTTRARVDSIRYKVNVNTMEQSSVDHLELNEIGRVVFTTGKELFFDPYRRNKQTGSFILIDPITNNTSAVGMIIDRVDAKDMVTEDALATLNLPEMGIGEEHYEAIRKVCEELGRQGVSVKCITEKR